MYVTAVETVLTAAPSAAAASIENKQIGKIEI